MASYCRHLTAVSPHSAITDATFYCRARNTRHTTLPAIITVRGVKRAFSLPLALSRTEYLWVLIKNKPNELSNLPKEAMALQSQTQKLRKGWKPRWEKSKRKHYIVSTEKYTSEIYDQMLYSSAWNDEIHKVVKRVRLLESDDLCIFSACIRTLPRSLLAAR